MTVFKIIHEQALDIDENDQIIVDRPWTRIELGYEAIQRGWLQRFKPNWIDLPILLAIGLHARPLVGADLEMFIEEGLARSSDKDRLYARITDMGLADILGCSRDWVRFSAERLGERGLLRILQLDPKNEKRQFRDSRGAFAGNSAYLLPGQVLVSSSQIGREELPPIGADRHADLVRMGASRHADSVRMDIRHNSLSHADSVHTKYITTSLTPAKNAGGAESAPAGFESAIETDSALDDEHAADRPTLDPSGNDASASRAGAAAETATGAHRSQRDIWQRLNVALGDEKIAIAFQAVLEVVESQLGFTEVGLRAARLAFAPLPDRRRRVLDDLRRMQGRADLKPSIRKRNVIGILTQNIGVTLGLGLAAEGSLRTLADRADYTAIGGLVAEYGADVVWLAACEIAGQRFEGDPIEYLRAALRNKRERERGAGGARPARDFESVDYLSEQVGIGAT